MGTLIVERWNAVYWALTGPRTLEMRVGFSVFNTTRFHEEAQFASLYSLEFSDHDFQSALMPEDLQEESL